ncbi:MAG TPA: hypothetical protein PK129_13760, partial [Cellvibrionaceae bacterium]|nr:hypothetical protein [Cellvibrionaceae bacterium]
SVEVQGQYVGGLVGNGRSGSLTTTGTLSVRNTLVGGGIIQELTSSGDRLYAGALSGSYGDFTESYWLKRPNLTTGAATTGGTALPLSTLTCPTQANNTSCLPGSKLYSGWNTTPSNQKSYWDMGTATQAPGLVLKGKTYRDSDLDSAADPDDRFPLNPAASADSDGDGAPDAWFEHCDASCRAASGLTLDLFPAQAAASVDIDADGQPDAWNANCDNTCQSASGLQLDRFPQDRDNDGMSDAKDTDDDGDGMLDADANSNGLIDIHSLAELDAIRFDPRGEGRRIGTALTPDASGCPQLPTESKPTCRGYELLADLDLDTNNDGQLDAADSYWNGGNGWQAIEQFNSLLEGNGHVLRNWLGQGVFGALKNAQVRRLGFGGTLTDIQGPALANSATDSRIEGVFVTGKVGKVNSIGFRGNISDTGGLLNSATNVQLTNVFSTAFVRGHESGGLVGRGSIQGAMLLTVNSEGYGIINTGASMSLAIINQSYWANSGNQNSQGGAELVALARLKCPTEANATTCGSQTLYLGWDKSKDLDGSAFWDFGTNQQLPGLRLAGRVFRDSDGDGYLDEDDRFPTEYAAALDRDGDGW